MAKQKGICKTCTYYHPDKNYPGFKAGKCDKGFTQFAGMDNRFDVSEDNSCKKYVKGKT